MWRRRDSWPNSGDTYRARPQPSALKAIRKRLLRRLPKDITPETLADNNSLANM